MKKNAPEIEYTYQTYVDDVLSGRIITGKHIRLACERFEKFKQNPSYYFDEEDVKKKIRIVSKLKHFTGKHNGKPFILLPYQQWVIASIFGFKYKSTGLRVTKKVFLMLSRKQGKALPITTPIPTPTGFTPMGDLQEGDLVFDETGKPCHVTFKTPIMTDHQLYKIIFDDGDEITADADHQWAIEEKGEQKIMTTQEIFEVYKTPRRGKEEGHRSLYSIPLTKPVEYEEKDYILHPYILGLWLGDGSIGKPNFSVSLEDLKLYDFAKFMYGYYKVVEGHNCLTVSFAGDKHKDNSLLRHQLISVGVFYRKHIPSEYLQGSIEQRLALLQGLMDTDGYVSEIGQCEFVQKSVELSDDFAELLSSLGIKYHRSVKVTGGRSYNKFTFYTSKDFPCFCLKRKYNRLKESLSPRLGRKFIRYVSPVPTEPVQCIQVDSPSHLYLAGPRFTPTHNTALASAIGILCAVADGEGNAEVDILANSRQQAKIAFDMTANFCESVDSRGKLFKRYRDSVMIPQSKSKIQVLSTDTAGLDGYNCSCGIIDEFHAAKNWDLYNVLVSSQGMREQPLMIVITTAGFLLAPYPCYTMRQTCIDILEGNKTDDSQFAAIYELDPEDDWKEEENWIKAAPSLGQTVFPEYLKEQVQSAINNPALEVGVKTKNFNIFCQSRDVWIQDEIITSCFKNIDLKDFQDEEAWMGVDLSAVSDLTATSIMFPPNPDRKLYPDKYIFKSWLYLPNDTIQSSVNSDFYKLWKAQGFVISTPGNVVDYDFILKDQISIYDQLYIPGIGYDSWNATQWAINATNEGLPLFPFSQTIGNFNRPTKNFEMLVKQGKVVIDYNPAVRWCFECVEIKSDFNGNCLALDTIVPTPSGYKTISELKVGDEVFNEKGEVTKIISTTDVNYGRDCYKITFANNAEVVCDYTHRWYVNHLTTTGSYRDGSRKTTKEYKIMDTDWMYNCSYHLHTKYPCPAQYPERTYTIDPYTLGQWLGDGDSSGSRFTVSEEDLYMYKYLENKYTLNYNYVHGNTYRIYTSGGLRTELKELGLLNNKHIPLTYMQGSIEQRLELLRGLMDTDGSCSKYNGQCTFSQCNKRYDLILQVSELLSSLGIRHTVKRHDNYSVVQFYTTLRVFNLERKYKNQLLFNPAPWSDNLPIKSIEKVESVPTKCITVDSPSHLFLITDKYVITSNCKPTKTVGDETKKIDPVIAMIQALGTYLNKTTYSDGEVLTA